MNITCVILNDPWYIESIPNPSYGLPKYAIMITSIT